MSNAEHGSAASSGHAAAPAKSSASSLVIIALLAVVFGGASAWYLVERGRSADAARSQDAGLAPKYIVHLEGFTVNLADTEETHFLRVTIDLGIDRLPDGVEKERAAANMPVARIRDAVLAVLTLCKAEPLLTPDGKALLKKNLLEGLHHSVPELDVRDVYFTEFLVQR
jgi:flagellar protein FliL